jgi:energy-coupling factor transporter ATP-binding protein EcfA2
MTGTPTLPTAGATPPNPTPHHAPITDAKRLPVRALAQIFGRNRELASGHVAIKAGTAIMLTGPAGIGKSTLAALLSAAYIAKNPGGVLWYPMEEDDADQLLMRVARSYGLVALPKGTDQRKAAVRTLLEKRRPLIVLDGLTDVEAIREFIRGVGAGVPMILMHDEQAAGPWTPISLSPLNQGDSTTVLRTISSMKESGFNADLDSLARLLGGDPLALHLVGHYMAATNTFPAELVNDFPTGGEPQPQTIKLIFRKLPPSLQGVFLIIGAMFTHTVGAELLTEITGMPVTQLAPIIKALKERGLVDEMVAYGQLRFTMHESVQVYARRWLEANHQLKAAQDRALSALVAYVKAHAKESNNAHDRLATELDNMIGAAAHATETRQPEPMRALIRSLSVDAGDFIKLRGFQTELEQLHTLETLLNIRLQEAEAPPAPPVPIPPELLEAPAEPQMERSLFAPPLKPPVMTPPPEPIPTPIPVELPPPPPRPVVELPKPDPIPVVIEPPKPVLPPPIVTPPPPPVVVKTPTVALPEEIDWFAVRLLSVADLRARIAEEKDKSNLARYYDLLGDQLAGKDIPGALEAYGHSVEAWRATENWSETARQMTKLGAAYESAAQPESAKLTYRIGLSIAYKAAKPALSGELCLRLGRHLIDDTRTLAQAEQLLSEAQQTLEGNSDAERWLKRARTRIDRLKESKTDFAPAIANVMFAAQAISGR